MSRKALALTSAFICRLTAGASCAGEQAALAWDGSKSAPLTGDRYGETFSLFLDRAASEQQVMMQAFNGLVDSCPQNFSMLEVGAGTGWVLREMIARSSQTSELGKYLGLEPIKAHVTQLRAFVDSLSFDAEAWQMGLDARTVDEVAKHGPFDLVLMMHSIYYMQDRVTILKKLCQALAPGGRLAVFISGPFLSYSLTNVFDNHLEAGNDHKLSSVELVASMRAAGLRPDVDYLPFNFDMTGLFEASGRAVSNELSEIISFFAHREFSQFPPGLQHDMVEYLKAATVVIDGKRVWPSATALVLLQASSCDSGESENSVCTQTVGSVPSVQLHKKSSFPGRTAFVPEVEPQVVPFDSSQIKLFFPPPDNEQAAQKLRLTNIGVWSMATPDVAEKISQVILSYFQPGASLTVTESCGNMGGNTINFARHFAQVQTTEIVPLHCDVLKSNLAQYTYTTGKVIVYCADFLDVMDKLQQDVIYMAPPWGGIGYETQQNLDLFLDNVHLGDIVNALLDRVQLVAMYVPYNFNFNDFQQKVESEVFHAHKVFFNESMSSDTYTLSYLLIVKGRVAART